MPPDRLTVEEFSILVTSEVLLQTSRHVAQNTTHEMGGFLLGNRYRCPNTGRDYIIIDQYSEAEFTESTDVSLTFTHEAWGQLDDNLTGKYYGKKLVGWYHSHPGMSIFLSEHDVNIHRERFAEPWMVALVLEPVKHLGGFFVWNNGKIDPNHYVNFYELLKGETRESVVAWGNYDGLDPVLGVAPQVQGDNTQTQTEPSNGSARRPRPPQPAPPPAPGFLPVWLQGNLAWFSAAALAVLIFLGALAAFYFPRNTNRNPATANAGVDVLKTLKSELEDRGVVNQEDGTVFVRLGLTGLSEDVAKGMGATVTIDGVEADVERVLAGKKLIIEATARLGGKVGKIVETSGEGESLRIAEAYDYGDNSRTFDRTVGNMRLFKNDPMNLAFGYIPPPKVQDEVVHNRPPRPPQPVRTPAPQRPPAPQRTPAPPPRQNNAQDSPRTLGIKTDIARIKGTMAALKGKMEAVKQEDRDKKAYKDMAAKYRLLQTTLASRESELAAAMAKRVD